MKIAKWGNSLAVRLPAEIVKTLDLKEGDHVEIHAKGAGELEVSHDFKRLQALESIRKLRRPLPPGYKFNREEIYVRGVREPELTSQG